MKPPITNDAHRFARSMLPLGSTNPSGVRRCRFRAGWVSRYVRGRKLEWFFARIEKDALILDFGCAEGWVEQWAKTRGWQHIKGLDLVPPADFVGDIADWEELGLQANSFDVIIAFEVVEHGDFAAVLGNLLKPAGLLMATTPVPRLDWVCKGLEAVRLLQPRTGPHTHLVDLRAYPYFVALDYRVRGFVSQWAVLRPR